MGGMLSNRNKKTKEFIRLQKKWYKKLAKSGFSDLEWTDEKTAKGQNTPYLRKSLNKFKHLTPEKFEEVSEFYSRAPDFASQHNFPTERHKFTWQLHIEGYSYRDSIEILTAEGFKPPSVFWISDHLTKLKKAYVTWLAEQPEEPETLADFMANNRGIDDLS